MREEEFINACATGNLELVKELLQDKNVDVNKLNESGWTAFHSACSGGHVEIVKLLLNNERIDLKEISVGGVLQSACSGGHFEIVKMLLNNECIDLKKILVNSTIHNACYRGHFEIVDLLLKNGVNTFILNYRGLLAFDDLPGTLDANTINEIKHNMKVYGYMYGHFSENNNLLNLPDAEFEVLRNEANTLLTTNPEVMNIFASKIFHQTAPKNVLDALTPKSIDLLVNELKNLCIKMNLWTILNGSHKIDAIIEALKEYYNFSEQQIKTIESGLEPNNSDVLDSLTNLLYSFETDIEGVSQSDAIFPGSLLDMMNATNWNVDFIKGNEQFALYKDVIENKSIFEGQEKNDATVTLIKHVLPEVKHLMVMYIANMIKSVASGADSFQGQEKEIVSKYFPQSLTTKSLGAIQEVTNEKFNDVFAEFAQKGYNPTAHGFAIYVIEALNGIGHNSTEYSFIDEILAKHDEKIKAKMAENKDIAENVAKIIEKAIEKDGPDHKLKDMVHKEFITSDDHKLLVADIKILLLNSKKLANADDYIDFINDEILCTTTHNEAIDDLLGQAYHVAMDQ
jgi:ankyrin repeat protein